MLDMTWGLQTLEHMDAISASSPIHLPAFLLLTDHKNQASPLTNTCGSNKMVHAAGNSAASRQREPLPAGHCMAWVIVNCPSCLAASPPGNAHPKEQSPVMVPPPSHLLLRTAFKALEVHSSCGSSLTCGRNASYQPWN